MSSTEILKELNSHPCKEALAIAKKELKKLGMTVVYDSYIKEFIVVG